MKKRFKNGIAFCFVITFIFIMTGILINGRYIVNNFIQFLAIGLATGTFFGFLLIGLMERMATKKTITHRIPVGPDEDILLIVSANHVRGKATESGRLYLTNKRLIFQAVQLNSDNDCLSFKLTDILGAEAGNVPQHKTNCLAVYTSMNETEKFVIEKTEVRSQKLSDNQAKNSYSHITNPEDPFGGISNNLHLQQPVSGK